MTDRYAERFRFNPPRLYDYLPPGLVFVVVADTSGVGEQRAGEGRQVVSLGTRTRDAIQSAVAVNDHAVTSHRGVLRTGAFWGRRGKRKYKRRRGDRDRTKGEMRE